MPSPDERDDLISVLRATIERLDAGVRATGEAVWDWDLADELTWHNAGIQTILRSSENDELPTLTGWAERVHPDDRAAVLESMLAAPGLPEERWEKQYRLLRDDGTYAYVSDSGTFLDDEEGNRIRMIGVVRDLSDLKETEQQLLGETTRLRAQLESSLDGVLMIDRSGRRVIQNHRMRQIWRLPADVAEDPQMRPQVRFAADLTVDPEGFVDTVRHLGADVAEIRRDEFLLRDGTVIDSYTAPVLDEQGHHHGRLWIHRDVTDQRRSEERALHLATHDHLTGLANSNLFVSMLDNSLDRARSHAHRVAVIDIDLDRFKVVNDGYGHPFGDLVLLAFTERLREIVGAEGTIARQGGDEFLVLLPQIETVEEATHLAEAIMQGLVPPLVVRERDVHLTASVGISVFPEDGATADELIDNADVAMYHAKDTGRATFVAFTRTMADETQRHIEVETHLRKAIAAQELSLAYQPKIDVATGDIVGCEALLRWVSPVLGPVSPGHFIPIAEDSGLIVPIGDWVLRTACLQTKAWTDAALPPITVSVNVSARQFLRQDLLAWVERKLAVSGLAPQQLELELTESVIAQDVEKVVTTFHGLHELGVKIAIDDFGTGYSNLSYLSRFHADALKIDQSFIRSMLTDEADAAIVRSTIQLAHNLGLVVVAEGVETADQLDFLFEQGCDQVQGFHLGRPMPASAFEALLRS